MFKEKRGVSLIVSYALLIVILIMLSMLVYSFLKLRLPSDFDECREGVSLTAENVVCSNETGIITFNVLNNGLFTVPAFFVRFYEKDSKVGWQLNKGRELLDNAILPDESVSFQGVISNYLISGEDEYVIEIQPAMVKDDEFVLCDVVRQKVFCGTKAESTLASPVLWLMFDGNMDDSSGNDYNGHCSICPSPVDGKFGNGYEFNSDGESVLVDDNDDISGLDEVTLMAWIKPSEWAKDCGGKDCYYQVIGKSNWGNGREYRFRYNSVEQALVFYVGNDGLSGSCDGTPDTNCTEVSVPVTEIPAGVWSHIAGTWNSVTDEVKVYVNGVEKGSGSYYGVMLNGDANFSVGTSSDNLGGAQDDFKGVIDEVRLYNVSLSEDEINALYDFN